MFMMQKFGMCFLNFDGQPFLPEPGNFGFILNFNFFQPYKHVNYSIGAIYISVLNLPRARRYKKENCLVVGLIPGPKEPPDMNNFLRPFVSDLIKLWEGVDMTFHSYRKHIRCALVCVACDIPAGRKHCGFLCFTAHLGCSRCLKKFPGAVRCKDYGGFDRQNWPLRTGEVHARNARKVKSAKTVSERETRASKKGCRFSELLELPYFDAPRMLIIDPMHNLFLGSAKRFFKAVLVDHLAISDSQFNLIQTRVDSFSVPSGIGHIPLKIQSGFASFTADQWKNWVLYYSIIILSLRDVLIGHALECWRHFVLACRVLCCKSISEDQVWLGDALLLQFCKRTERLFGTQCITPNVHLHCHMRDCIVDYGPLYGFWCYAFERYNGILGSMPNTIEIHLMRRFWRENQVLTSPLPDLYFNEFAPVFPKVQDTGSVGETLEDELMPTLSSAPLANGWTIESLQVYQLPKHSYRQVLNSTHKEYLLQLFCRLYSVQPADVDLRSVCRLFTYISMNNKLFGSCSSRTASSSIVFVKWDLNVFGHTSSSGPDLRPAKINFFCEHVITIKNEDKSHLVVYLSWYKSHPKNSDFGKPVTV